MEGTSVESEHQLGTRDSANSQPLRSSQIVASASSCDVLALPFMVSSAGRKYEGRLRSRPK